MHKIFSTGFGLAMYEGDCVLSLRADAPAVPMDQIWNRLKNSLKLLLDNFEATGEPVPSEVVAELESTIEELEPAALMSVRMKMFHEVLMHQRPCGDLNAADFHAHPKLSPSQLSQLLEYHAYVLNYLAQSKEIKRHLVKK